MILSVIWTEVEYRHATIEVPDDGPHLTDAEILALAVASDDAETTEVAARHLDGTEWLGATR